MDSQFFFFNMYPDYSKSFLKLNDSLIFKLDDIKQAFVFFSIQFNSVQSLSRVQLFATPWIAACQASLSITNSRSSPRLTSISQ